MLNTDLFKIGQKWEIENAGYYDRECKYMIPETKEEIKELAEKAYYFDIYESIPEAYYFIAMAYGSELAEKFIAELIEAGYTEEDIYNRGAAA